MRVVYLNPAGALGGAERSLLDLLATVRSFGPVEPHLIVGAEGPLADEALRLDAKVTILPMPDALAAAGDSGGLATTLLRSPAIALAARGYRRRLARAIHSVGPDLVHSNGIKSHILAATCGACDVVPLVWHMRDFVGRRRFVGRLLRRAIRPNVTLVANSQATANDARQALRPGEPVHVIYNGIDTAEFSPGPGDGARLDQLAGLPPANGNVVRIGLVATYARWKGHDVFLEAIARLEAQAANSAARFYIVGGPIYQTAGSQFSQEELRARARDLRIEDRIGFVEFQQRPAWVYRSLNIVVHASTQPEPFGRTIVEAMSCARAVVVARGGGATELLEGDVNGIGVAPGDADGLMCAISRLVRDPDLRGSIGNAGRHVVLARFDRSRVAQQVWGLYTGLLPSVRR